MFNPLKIELKRSTLWYHGLSAIHLLAVFSLLLTPLSVFTQVVLAIGLLLSFISFFKFPINSGVSAFVWNQDQPLFATIDDQGKMVQHAMPNKLLRLPFLVCIYVDATAPVASQWLILLPDMMSKSNWRKLQVMTRWSELPA